MVVRPRAPRRAGALAYARRAVNDQPFITPRVVSLRMVQVHSPESAEMAVTQRATAASRVGSVSVRVWRP